VHAPYRGRAKPRCGANVDERKMDGTGSPGEAAPLNLQDLPGVSSATIAPPETLGASCALPGPGQPPYPGAGRTTPGLGCMTPIAASPQPGRGRDRNRKWQAA
jgi:hypothetical protein